MKGGRYHVVTSTKPKRVGEAFIMRAGKFIAKVYKEVADAEMFAEHVCRLLNAELDRPNSYQGAHENLRHMAGFGEVHMGAEYTRALIDEYDAAIKTLQRIKFRLHFMGWPAEAFWNAGTEEKPRWIEDWRYEIDLIENALHGSPLTKPEKPDDTKPAHEIEEVLWMYEHDGCLGPPIVTRTRHPDNGEPWTETRLIVRRRQA